jgi:hypothetical protein
LGGGHAYLATIAETHVELHPLAEVSLGLLRVRAILDRQRKAPGLSDKVAGVLDTPPNRVQAGVKDLPINNASSLEWVRK